MSRPAGGDNWGTYGPVADARRGCCTHTVTNGEGWWDLCPAHTELMDEWETAMEVVLAWVSSKDPREVRAAVTAALEVVGSKRTMDLPTDADRVRRFMDALALLS